MATGAQVAGQQYTTDAPTCAGRHSSPTRCSPGHRREGILRLAVVFVDETGSKEKRRKRLAVMDMDGANVKYLTPAILWS